MAAILNPVYIPENETLATYLMKAIVHPGKTVNACVWLYNPNTGDWTDIDDIDCTFIDLRNKYGTNNVTNEGAFYFIDPVFADPGFDFLGIKSVLLKTAPAGWSVVGGFWAVAGIVVYRMKKKNCV